MNRYIDIEPIIAWCNDPEVCEPYGVNSVELERKLLNAPSIDIVHCGECKAHNNVNMNPAHIMCGYMSDDDFCSYGKRETE